MPKQFRPLLGRRRRRNFIHQTRRCVFLPAGRKMKYDTNNPRYAHLQGLSDQEIAQVMALANLAIDFAKNEAGK